MGKYAHLNEQEVIRLVECYGSEDEQEILAAFKRYALKTRKKRPVESLF